MKLVKDIGIIKDIVEKIYNMNNLEIIPNFAKYLTDNFLVFYLGHREYAILPVLKEKPKATILIDYVGAKFDLNEYNYITYWVNKCEAFTTTRAYSLYKTDFDKIYEISAKMNSLSDNYIRPLSLEELDIITPIIQHNKDKYIKSIRRFYEKNKMELSFYVEPRRKL